LRGGQDRDGKAGRADKGIVAAGTAIDAPQDQRRFQRNRGKGIDGDPDMGRFRPHGSSHHGHAGGELPQGIAESAGIQIVGHFTLG